MQGSGWGWLALQKETGKLVVATTANQDPLQPTTGLVPLLGVDVWEHAYVSCVCVCVALSWGRTKICPPSVVCVFGGAAP